MEITLLINLITKSSETASRFFSGAWNRQYINTVEAVLKNHDSHGENVGEFNPDLTKQARIEALFTDLKNQLVKHRYIRFQVLEALPQSMYVF